MTEKCIAFTGGGTGGHIFPGLAIIEQLKTLTDARIVWIGSSKPLERAAVESFGIEFFSIPSGKLRRSFSIKNAMDFFRVLSGFFAAKALLKKLKPLLLFSKGGYVSVPPCYAAASLGIPVFTHESDLSPGLATRLNAKKAQKVFLSWENSKRFFPESFENKILVSGNPIRESLKKGDAVAGRAWLGFDNSLPVILVLGGSQGAVQVNKLIEAVLPELKGKARIAHQYGDGNNAIAAQSEFYNGFSFVKNEIADLYAAADIIIGRSGAGTICEGAALAKPMIFIPLAGRGTRGDQVENAAFMEAANAAISLTGQNASKEGLLSALAELLDSATKRKAMGANAAGLVKADASFTIATVILEFSGKA